MNRITQEDLNRYLSKPWENTVWEMMAKDLQETRARLAALEAAAREVVDSREEVHSVERGEGYLVCGAYLDALRLALDGEKYSFLNVPPERVTFKAPLDGEGREGR